MHILKGQILSAGQWYFQSFIQVKRPPSRPVIRHISSGPAVCICPCVSQDARAADGEDLRLKHRELPATHSVYLCLYITSHPPTNTETHTHKQIYTLMQMYICFPHTSLLHTHTHTVTHIQKHTYKETYIKTQTMTRYSTNTQSPTSTC